MSIRYRTLDYANTDEVRRYLTLFYAIPSQLDDYHVERSPEFITRSVAIAQQEENATNTFAAIVLDESEKKFLEFSVDIRFDSSTITNVPPLDCSVMGDAELLRAGHFFSSLPSPHRSNDMLAKLTLCVRRG